MKKQYAIADQFNFFNDKVFQPDAEWEENEVKLLSISFNAEFGNLRVAFREFENTYILGGGTGYNLAKCKPITTIALYPEHALQLLDAQSNHDKVRLVERAFSDKWIPNKTFFDYSLETTPLQVKTTPAKSSTKFVFSFSDWQVKGLNKSLIYLLNGGAFNSQMSYILTTNFGGEMINNSSTKIDLIDEDEEFFNLENS